MKLAAFIFSAASALSTYTAPNGNSLNVTYDATLDAVVFDVLLKDKSYVALGFGKSLQNTDMVYWGANGDDSQQLDMFAESHETLPLIDAANNFETTFEVKDDKSVHFKSIRSLNPGTDPRTYII